MKTDPQAFCSEAHTQRKVHTPGVMGTPPLSPREESGLYLQRWLRPHYVCCYSPLQTLVFPSIRWGWKKGPSSYSKVLSMLRYVDRLGLESTQCLRALATLPEVPSTYIKWLPTTCNSTSRHVTPSVTASMGTYSCVYPPTCPNTEIQFWKLKACRGAWG